MSNQAAPTYKASILIVDDTPDNLRLLSSMLQSQGYLVRKAINGQLALRGVEAAKPDLILLDINMPGMNGYQVCQKLKSVEQTKHIPVIFISALNEALDKVQSFQVGGVDYITKPFHIEEVLARVENQLSLHRLQQQLVAKNQQLQLEIIERKKAEEEVRFLLATTQLISESTDFYSALEVTIHQVCQIIGWDLGEAWIPNNQSATLEYSRGWYAKEAHLESFIEHSKSLTFYPNIGIPGKVWLSHKLEWVANLDGERDRFFDRYEIALEVGLQTALSVPIIEDDQVLAILVFFKKNQSEPEQKTIELVNAVANQLASLIHRKKIETALVQANQELERLATSDGLTGIANRRRFDEYFCQEWLRLFRKNLPISLILADVDFFKLYNDTYGHLVGDFCLQHIAATISKCVNSPTDLVARYGGEEFAVILPNTDADAAWQLAVTIRQEVQKLQIAHVQSPVEQFVTLSLGVATVIPNHEVNLDGFIDVADKALYSAKKQGRNCVVAKNIIPGI
jgi:two-component system cell cycle response regulator